MTAPPRLPADASLRTLALWCEHHAPRAETLAYVRAVSDAAARDAEREDPRCEHGRSVYVACAACQEDES